MATAIRLLVVEVTDDTVIADLTIKSALYGKAGYPVYWVVTPDAIYEHTVPTPQGCRTRTQYRPGEDIPVGYAGASLAGGRPAGGLGTSRLPRGRRAYGATHTR